MRPFLRLLTAAMLLPMMLSEGVSAQSLGDSLTLGGSGNGSGSFEGGPLLVASTGTSATPWTVPAGGTLAVVAVQPLQLWGSLIVDASGGQITATGTLVVNQGGTLQLGGPSGVGLITIISRSFCRARPAGSSSGRWTCAQPTSPTCSWADALRFWKGQLLLFGQAIGSVYSK